MNHRNSLKKLEQELHRLSYELSPRNFIYTVTCKERYSHKMGRRVSVTFDTLGLYPTYRFCYPIPWNMEEIRKTLELVQHELELMSSSDQFTELLPVGFSRVMGMRQGPSMGTKI